MAHLALFRKVYVDQKSWLDDEAFGRTVALSQLLPGPASSQVGFLIGWHRGGALGALLAWLGFTIPAMVLMVVAAMGVILVGDLSGSSWVQGLKIAALVVVGDAVFAMWRRFCMDRTRATIALLSAVVVLDFASAWISPVVILLGGLAGHWWIKNEPTASQGTGLKGPSPTLSRKLAITAVSMVVLLPLLGWAFPSPLLTLMERFTTAGALVFGGGHVVLPLLEGQWVATGAMPEDVFLAGYGLAQAIPGPLFSFSAYLGTWLNPSGNPFLAAAVALLSVFAPSLLLAAGVQPIWSKISSWPSLSGAIQGIHAAVVGLLISALLGPIWGGAVVDGAHLVLAMLGVLALMVWRLPVALVVAGLVILAQGASL